MNLNQYKIKYNNKIVSNRIKIEFEVDQEKKYYYNSVEIGRSCNIVFQEDNTINQGIMRQLEDLFKKKRRPPWVNQFKIRYCLYIFLFSSLLVLFFLLLLLYKDILKSENITEKYLNAISFLAILPCLVFATLSLNLESKIVLEEKNSENNLWLGIVSNFRKNLPKWILGAIISIITLFFGVFAESIKNYLNPEVQIEKHKQENISILKGTSTTDKQ